MNVLFLTQTSELGPSSRYRVYQLLPLLERLGIRGLVSPAIEDSLYRELYLGQRGGGWRLKALAATWRKRKADLNRLDDFNAVFIQKGIFPGMYAGFERTIASRKPTIFDFDDAIWLPRVGGSPILRAFHRESAVQDLLRRATAVVAGNDFLADYAGRLSRNVTVIPTSIDVAAYPRSNKGSSVGWIGSRTTLAYLKPLAPVFRKLGIKPRVIASGNPSQLDFDVEFRPWRLETELEELAQIGVGIAPLPDTPWERGKCGVKILQYMACGIPVVASPVGVQQRFVQPGETGFLVRTESEWIKHLGELIESPELREKLGASAKKIVAKNFDISSAASNVAAVLRSAVGT